MRVDQWGKTWRKGDIRISLPSGFASDEEERFEIELADEVSGVHFLEISITPADLMKALANRGVSVEFSMTAVERVGCVRERKTVFVPELGGHEYTNTRNATRKPRRL